VAVICILTGVKIRNAYARAAMAPLINNGGIEMQEILNFVYANWLLLVAAFFGGVALSLSNNPGTKWGILFRWGSWWIGGHWSDHNKRLCVNPVPMITIWITAEGGETPDVGYGFDIYRNDK